jgi:hypothetical protein
MPFRIKPDRGQVPENSLKPPTKESCDVLHDDVTRSKLARKSSDFRPKPRARSVSDASTLPGKADVLARESASNEFNGNSVCVQSLLGEGSHVFVAGHIGPVLFEDGAAVGLDLAEGDGSHPRPLKSEGEAADTREKVEDIHNHRPSVCST